MGSSFARVNRHDRQFSGLTHCELSFILLLKHVRDWSYETLSREVRANLVYREFTRIGGEKVPDDRTMGNLGRQLGPEVIAKLHRRVVEIAQENKIAEGRKMRVDTTVVETDIHYPTDSALLGDGVRVLTRIILKTAIDPPPEDLSPSTASA